MQEMGDVDVGKIFIQIVMVFFFGTVSLLLITKKTISLFYNNCTSSIKNIFMPFIILFTYLAFPTK